MRQQEQYLWHIILIWAKVQFTVWDSGTPETPKTPGLPRLPRLRDSRKTDGKSESNQSQVSQLSKPFSSSDSSLKMSAEGFCLLHKRMIHTNHGELLRIFDTYCRVWKAGGQATLTTSTEGGLLKANLDIQLGWPSAACPGAPPPHLVRPTAWSSSPSSTSAPGHSGARSCLQRRRRRHRGPAAKARSNARAAAYQVSLAAGKVGTASAPCSPPPPPPPSTVLTWSIKFVERKASIRPSFCQLDGKGGSVESINESEVRHGDASSPSPSSSPPSTTPTLRAQKLRMVCTGCWNTWEAILTNNAGSRRCHEDICIDDSWRRADMERCFRSAQDHPVS